MDRQQIEAVFKKCGAFLQGHFQLTSGLHSPGYLQCALVCQDPVVCAQLCEELARRIPSVHVDAVIGPAMGGIVPAYELARALSTRPQRSVQETVRDQMLPMAQPEPGTRGIYAERGEDGRMTLRRGFSLDRGERVVIVEDVMTTGGSAAELIEIAEAAGAEVVGVVALVDRGGAKRFEGRRYPAFALLPVELPTYKPEECPLCKEGKIPLVKPGSRKRPGA
jgi:orotate phosphoribosyltransferase